MTVESIKLPRSPDRVEASVAVEEQFWNARAEEIARSIYPVSGNLKANRGFTLTAVMRNEMYFLPAFLNHYRTLGVERFVFIDDNSDDGSREYLAQQNDVIVLGSSYSYGDRIAPLSGIDIPIDIDYRAATLWRQYLLDFFATEAWSLHVDLDEFIYLPSGMTLPNLAARLDPAHGQAVWAVMLDAYPAHIDHLIEAQDEKTLDLDRDWYFDGRPHVVFDSRTRYGLKGPVMIYGGVRARLRTKYSTIERPSLKDKARWYLRDMFRWHLQGQPPIFNDLRKPSLIYWRGGDQFHEVHRTSKPHFRDRLIPMMHFKFTGAVYAKLRWAVESGAYYKKSQEYRELAELISALTIKRAYLTDRCSRLYKEYSDFEVTGNAFNI